MGVSSAGRWMVVAGIAIAVVGGCLVLGGRIGLGRLPGDLTFGGDRVRVYVPIATCLVVSVVGTILLNLFFRR